MNRIAPAGHANTISSRAYAAEPISDLEKEFHNWRTGVGDYANVRHLFQETPRRIAELHELLLKYRPENHTNVGLLVSLAYQMCNEKIITYDLDCSIHLVGDELPYDKLLVNRGRTGDAMGWDSAGVILNLGQTGHDFGFNSEGIIINAGHTGQRFGKGGICHIAMSDPESYDDDKEYNDFRKRYRAMRDPESYDYDKDYPRILVRPKEIQGALKTYLNELTELCKGPTEHIHARYGEIPALTINQELHKLVKP